MVRACCCAILLSGARAFAPAARPARARRARARVAAETSSAPERLARAATVWRFAGPVVAKYLGADAQIRLRERVLGQCLDEEACEVVWDGVHAEGAEAFREIVDMLGGFYVKTGQVIASRQDLFPRQYIDALDGLTDMVEPPPCRRDVFLAEEAEAVSGPPLSRRRSSRCRST